MLGMSDFVSQNVPFPANVLGFPFDFGAVRDCEEFLGLVSREPLPRLVPFWERLGTPDQRYLTANGTQHLKDLGAMPMPTKVKVLKLSLGDLLTKGSIRNPKANPEWVNRSLKNSYSCSERVISCDQTDASPA
jgi:hypothetical protein